MEFETEMTQHSLLNTRTQPPEFNLMNQIYKHQRFIYDASRKYYLLGRDNLIKGLKPPHNGTILELGCGTGRNLIQAANKYKDAEFYGIDISTEMLKTAQSTIRRRKLSRRIHISEGDATIIDPEATFNIRQFDRLFISFSLSMIPAWPQVIAHAQTLLRPGGELHIVDFGDCDGLSAMFRNSLYWWLARFHVHPIQGMSTKLKYAAEQAGNSCRSRRLLRGYSVYTIIKKPLT
ncbi:MAG: O-methyltransferase [Rhodomicrobium sp.]|nr:MAG: O-methyltransferase [Rhodomicrobium sp.]